MTEQQRLTILLGKTLTRLAPLLEEAGKVLDRRGTVPFTTRSTAISVSRSLLSNMLRAHIILDEVSGRTKERKRLRRLVKMAIAGMPARGTMSDMAKRLTRPRDPVQRAKLIGDIATGQIEDVLPDDGKDPTAVALGRARAAALSPRRRSEIAKNAVRARWERYRKERRPA
jgi:hypothetical protein